MQWVKQKPLSEWFLKELTEFFLQCELSRLISTGLTLVSGIMCWLSQWLEDSRMASLTRLEVGRLSIRKQVPVHMPLMLQQPSSGCSSGGLRDLGNERANPDI